MKLLVLVLLLTSCGDQGMRGHKGRRGYVIYPVGKGYDVITKCQHQWAEEDFKFKTFFSVREKEDASERVVLICTARENGVCGDSEYTSIRIPSSSRAFSTPAAEDGLVYAQMVGATQTTFTNLHGAQANVECDDSGAGVNTP